jgi:hypothetical protein
MDIRDLQDLAVDANTREDTLNVLTQLAESDLVNNLEENREDIEEIL